MHEIDTLKFRLDLSPELKATYDLYQYLLFALQTKNSERLNHLLKTEYPLVSPELQTAFQTFKTYQSYIKNTLTTPYTNGPIEGINNNIKDITCIAFQYHNFYHFKSCILMSQNSTKPKLKLMSITTRISIYSFIVIGHNLITNNI